MVVVTLEERGRQIQTSLDAGVRMPPREVLVNDGRRRTRGKRDLLAAVERVRRESGRAVVFEAKF